MGRIQGLPEVLEWFEVESFDCTEEGVGAGRNEFAVRSFSKGLILCCILFGSEQMNMRTGKRDRSLFTEK